MTKLKSKISNILLVIAGVVWFLLISFITAQTEYQKVLAGRLGVSNSMEDILNILIIVVTFIPSGFLFAYVYAKKILKGSIL